MGAPARRRLAELATVAALGAALAGCGGGEAPRSPEEVVRAWSAALNSGDNDAAADLFARNVTVVQGDLYATLTTHEAAVRFNESLPCSGEVVELVAEGNQVTATFLLGDRQSSRCDAPGQLATAIFVVEDGKIVVWQQVPTPAEAPADDSAEPAA